MLVLWIFQILTAIPLNSEYIVSDMQKRGTTQSLPEKLDIPQLQDTEQFSIIKYSRQCSLAQERGFCRNSDDTNQQQLVPNVGNPFQFEFNCGTKQSKQVCDSVK